MFLFYYFLYCLKNKRHMRFPKIFIFFITNLKITRRRFQSYELGELLRERAQKWKNTTTRSQTPSRYVQIRFYHYKNHILMRKLYHRIISLTSCWSLCFSLNNQICRSHCIPNAFNLLNFLGR